MLCKFAMLFLLTTLTSMLFTSFSVMIKFAFILERLCGESGQVKKWNFHNYLKVDTKILESGKNITTGEWCQWHIEIADTPFNTAPALSSICSPDSLTLIYLSLYRILGFPGGTSGKESACQCRKCNRLVSFPRSGRPPWRRTRLLTPVFLPGESHGQRSLAGYSP